MATKSSREEWPTEFKAVKVSDSFVGIDFTFYFVTGVVNRNQYKYVEEAINVLAVYEIEEDKLVLSTLLNQEQLEGFHEAFEPLSKKWRGQYYSLANAIVDAYREAVQS